MIKKEKQKKEIIINCFNKLAIFVDGTEQSAYMNSQKARELMAFLITYKGESVNKVTICDALWGDKPLECGKDSLYKLVKKIKKMPIPFKIVSAKGIMQLRLDNINCDIVAFEKLLADNKNIKNMEEAISLYKGTLFLEESYNWAYLKEGYYDNKYLDTLDILEKHFTQIGDKRKAAYYKKLMDYYN